MFVYLAEFFAPLLEFLGLSAGAIGGFMATVTAVPLALLVRRLLLVGYAFTVFMLLYALVIGALQLGIDLIVGLLPLPPYFLPAMSFISPRHGQSMLSIMIGVRVALLAFHWGVTRTKWLIEAYS